MKLEFQKGSRSKLLAILVCGIMAVFVVRLFYLQVVQHGMYLERAYEEQVKPLVIPAHRGLIYAMDGDEPVRLVMNETIYMMIADPQTVTKPEKVVDAVREIAGGNARPKLSEMLAKKDSRYQVLATKLSRKQAEMMKAKKLIGIRLVETSQRVYPEASLAAQTLGFVNAEGVGQYGIEGKLNDRLKGKDGLLRSVTDISNVPLTIGSNNVHVPAKNGDNVVLTLDRNIQAYTEKALAKGLHDSKATNGSVIVMNPQTGKVMAMANLPTYNPAEFNKVQDGAAFNNAVITSPYEPGSDIKTLMVATGLDKGVIQPDSTYNNLDYIKVEDRTIGNATKGQTGVITMQHALNYSLNTGMVTIAQRLGDGKTITRAARDTMYQYYHDRFGFGELTGIEAAGEQSGIVIPPTSTEGNAVRYSNMAFGQGMDLTMVQVAAAFSSIINGGTYYKPTVLAGTMSDDLSTFTKQESQIVRSGVITPKSSDTVRDMVHQARLFLSGVKDKPGYTIGGKTGTSQTIENGKYVDNQTVGTYLGFGGTDKPEYVIMVQVSGKNMNLEGGKHAMPIFTDISNWMIDYLKLQPKG
jgi:cell division protein FtsI/penicillin-binding protein 2